MTYPDGTAASYTYTARDQLKTISFAGSLLVNYGYDLNGNRTGKTLGNTTTSAYAYDDANRSVNLTHNKGVGTLASFAYGYSAVGNRTHVRREDTRGDVYGYDATDQITGVQYKAADPGGVPSGATRNVGYAYDPVGNRTGVTNNGALTSYGSNNLNQYTAVGTSAPAYDANGNLGRHRRANYTYDAQNRMVSVSSGYGTGATYTYDGRNRRVTQAVTYTVGNFVTTHFYYDNWNLLEEHASSGVQQARYVHGASIDELLTRATPAGTAYYHQDALGNVIALSNSAGTATERYSYDVYGAPTFKDGNGNTVSSSASGNRFLFTGREYLASWSLYDYRNRFYSPELGRFLQTDPIGLSAGDLNLYRYVGNGPILFSDPFGLCYERDFIGPLPEGECYCDENGDDPRWDIDGDGLISVREREAGVNQSWNRSTAPTIDPIDILSGGLAAILRSGGRTVATTAVADGTKVFRVWGTEREL